MKPLSPGTRLCVPISRRALLAAAAGFALPRGGAAAPTRIIFIAGRKSHGYGQHGHNSGSLLMAQMLRQSVPGVEAVVCQDGWPADESVLENAAAIVLYMDGGDQHPILPHLEKLDALMKKGTGLVALHYALVIPKGGPGDFLLDNIGAYYETHWSVNPQWTARFDTLPAHPITRGAKPFAIFDEWYFHMRFRENAPGITPILTAVPPDGTREKEFGPHSGNPAVRAAKGQPEHLAWAFQRPGRGRGFGFTGFHYNWSLANDSFRAVLLNGIAWTAGLEIPAAGVCPHAPSWQEFLHVQEGQMPDGFSRDKAMQLIGPR